MREVQIAFAGNKGKFKKTSWIKVKSTELKRGMLADNCGNYMPKSCLRQSNNPRGTMWLGGTWKGQLFGGLMRLRNEVIIAPNGSGVH